MTSNHTNSITKGEGYLLRDRPGSDVPVGREAAVLLSDYLTDREIEILLAVEQLGRATAEQLARAFFNSHRSAYETLLPLVNRRFLTNIGAQAFLIRSAVSHQPPPRNPVYILDWNGYYYLSNHLGYRLRNWHPSTAALVTSRFGHTIGISDIWSYLLAAARATQELDLMPEGEDPWRYRFSIHFRNERASMLTQQRGQQEARTADPDDAESSSSNPSASRMQAITKGRERGVRGEKVLLQPDGAFTLAICELSPHSDSGPGPGSGPGSGPANRGTHPRWDPTLCSWEDALLPKRPSGKVMVQGEEAVKQGVGSTYYRTLLLEMETGANNSKRVNSKIAAYNRLLRTGERVWTRAYGIGPRVLVVVRTDAQIDREASIWRADYFHRQETAVLLTSLQTLARVYRHGSEKGNGSGNGSGRRALLDEQCWLDVMMGNSAWKTLGEALRLGVVLRKLR